MITFFLFFFFLIDSIEEDELVENATQRPITLEEENDKNCRIM